MSYYIVKVYGLVCDNCEASEEHVPPVDEPYKLEQTRRVLSESPFGMWTRKDGKDLCPKCSGNDGSAAAVPEGTAAARR